MERFCQYQPCSKPITGRKNKRFCSNTCRTYHSHGDNVVPGVRQRNKTANAPKSSIYSIKCQITGILFTARRPDTLYHPSVTALDKYHHSKVLKGAYRINCIDCGLEFKSRKSTPLRCSICRKQESCRVQRSKRRALIRMVRVESVSPFKVFTRDNWTCKQCGQPTPKELRGKQQPNSPELDHIIPISKGGMHSYNNTQCLCRKCNNEKSDILVSIMESIPNSN